ncbi:DUF6616 family protein [Mucilaginibacter sp. L3T2-6]|uniref:DUF6616 family protein n=1 Tax=Mucilaginibacter sp. L3T2-6 TaxID=3062491 RepID=UPI0026767628|nr:DUF6616 family protein [Mucilaginibacter sp. L3T2-6]MDO3644703.1 hypothetical protein [Mucilaginibacter sp. L3T2-6]MDV6217155.1 DUF6616 family protein [Mucilaginibacter sp. L3T2-6]
MKYYIEAWSAKQAWHDLSQEDRGAYMAQLGPAIQQMAEQGVEIISWGLNDKDTDNRLDFDFFAIWKFPSDEMAKTFEGLVNGAGWYNYFEQHNIKGDQAGPQEVIARMIGL